MAAVVKYVKDSPEFSDADREWARWAREQSEYKFAVDLQSKMVDAGRDMQETIARRLLKRNRPVGEIMEDTGLTLEQIKGLRVTD